MTTVRFLCVLVILGLGIVNSNPVVSNLRSRVHRGAASYSQPASITPEEEQPAVEEQATSLHASSVLATLRSRVMKKKTARAHQNQKAQAPPTEKDLEYLSIFRDELPFKWKDTNLAFKAKIDNLIAWDDFTTVPVALTGQLHLKDWVKKIKAFVQHKNKDDGKELIIIGAGPAGLSSALYALQHDKYKITVYEKRCDFTRWHPVDLEEMNCSAKGAQQGGAKGMLPLALALGLVNKVGENPYSESEVGKYFGFVLASQRINISMLQRFLAACFVIGSGTHIEFGQELIEVAENTYTPAFVKPFVTPRTCAQQETDLALQKNTVTRFKTGILASVNAASGSTDTAWEFPALTAPIDPAKVPFPNFPAVSRSLLGAKQSTDVAVPYHMAIRATGGGWWTVFPAKIQHRIDLQQGRNALKTERLRNQHGGIVFIVLIVRDRNPSDLRTALENRARGKPDGWEKPAVASALPGIQTTRIFTKEYEHPDGNQVTMEIPLTVTEGQKLWPYLEDFQWPRSSKVGGADPDYTYNADDNAKLAVIYRILKAMDATTDVAATKLADRVFGTYAGRARLLEAKVYHNAYRSLDKSKWVWADDSGTGVDATLGKKMMLVTGDALRDAYPQFAMGVNEAAYHGFLVGEAIKSRLSEVAAKNLDDEAPAPRDITAIYKDSILYEETSMMPKMLDDVLTQLYEGATDPDQYNNDATEIAAIVRPKPKCEAVGSIANAGKLAANRKVGFVYTKAVPNGAAAKCEIQANA